MWIEPLGTHFSEFLIKMQNISLKKYTLSRGRWIKRQMIENDLLHNPVLVRQQPTF